LSPAVLHATTIALWRGGAWRGVLLRGASGTGKSSLALCALERGWRLVADDRTLVWASGGALFGRAPATLAGLMEARGLGVLSAPRLDHAQIVLAVDLVGDPGALERLPEPAGISLAGADLPLIRLWPHEPAATAKLALCVAGAATPLGAG